MAIPATNTVNIQLYKLFKCQLWTTTKLWKLQGGCLSWMPVSTRLRAVSISYLLIQFQLWKWVPPRSGLSTDPHGSVQALLPALFIPKNKLSNGQRDKTAINVLGPALPFAGSKKKRKSIQYKMNITNLVPNLNPVKKLLFPWIIASYMYLKLLSSILTC